MHGHITVNGKKVDIPSYRVSEMCIRDRAKRHLVRVSMDGTTIPHEAIGKFGRGHVVLMPAAKGTGVLAGGPARAVMELAGIKDIKLSLIHISRQIRFL